MLSHDMYMLCHIYLLYYNQEVRGNERIFRKTDWFMALLVLSDGLFWYLECMDVNLWYYW